MKPTLIYLGLCLSISILSAGCHSAEMPSPPLIEVKELPSPAIETESQTHSNATGRIGKLTTSDLLKLAKTEDPIGLKLFDGAIVTAHLSRVRKINNRGLSLFGQIENDPAGFLSVTYFNGSAVGSARINGQTYAIRNHSDGSILLQEISRDDSFHCETEKPKEGIAQ